MYTAPYSVGKNPHTLAKVSYASVVDAHGEEVCRFHAKSMKEVLAKASIVSNALNHGHSAELFRKAAELFEAFLTTLNEGWLGRCVGDIGMLNEAYLTLTKARKAEKNESKK